MRRSWRGPLAVIGVAPLALLLGVMAGPQPPAHAIGGLDTTATATYTVDFTAGVVRGRIEFGFVNSVADAPTPDGAQSTVFSGFQFGLPGDATNTTANTAAGPLALTLAPADEFQLASVDFGTPLEFGDRLDMVVTFDLPGYPPRSAAPGRANQAFAAFVAWAYGDPGLGTVRIVTPADAVVSMPGIDDGSAPRPQVVASGDSTIYTFPFLPQPDQFNLFVTAAHDDALMQRQVHVDGHDVVVQAWPDDRRWSRFVTRQVRSGLPALAELIGRPARDRDWLFVRESPAGTRGLLRVVRLRVRRDRGRRAARPDRHDPRTGPRVVRRRHELPPLDHRRSRRVVRQRGRRGQRWDAPAARAPDGGHSGEPAPQPVGGVRLLAAATGHRDLRLHGVALCDRRPRRRDRHSSHGHRAGGDRRRRAGVRRRWIGRARPGRLAPLPRPARRSRRLRAGDGAVRGLRRAPHRGRRARGAGWCTPALRGAGAPECLVAATGRGPRRDGALGVRRHRRADRRRRTRARRA